MDVLNRFKYTQNDLQLHPLTHTGILPASKEYCVFPGFCEVYVHLREPGFSYTAARTASRAG